ncbi:unnamed protein product [Trifolium pratense]|uniref:Uncharacterized protein n=1 Tax=Trifolium pratense TaxID=57577 RepID=A0ACB0JW72_TRIPR|nr:unnamed protein product [Trifolium pratense]
MKSYSYKLQLLLILLLITVNTSKTLSLPLPHIPTSGFIPKSEVIPTASSRAEKLPTEKIMDGASKVPIDGINAASANYGSSLITSLFLGFAFVTMLN